MHPKIQCAILGLGNQAAEHLAASLDHPDIQIVAGIDANSKKWHITQQHFSQLELSYFENLAALKQSQIQIDAFILALPHHAYSQIWSELMQWGKPLLKEKPLGRDYQEAQIFMQTAKAAGCGFQTAIQRRAHPSYQYLFKLLKEQKVEIQELHAHLHLGKAALPDHEVVEENWRTQRHNAGGGALLDAGYHLIDLIQYYIGDFDVISATMWKGETIDNGIDIEDRCWLIGRSKHAWLMLDTWVQGEPDANGNLQKSEAILLKTNQGIYKVNREGIWQNNEVIYTADRDWQPAMRHQLGTFASNIRHQSWHSDVIIDQLPAMRKIEEAYRLSSRY